MTRPIHSRAPGKLFLIGEYAVLDGAPALLTAVDRYVEVTLRPSPDDLWRVAMPGTGLDPITLGVDGGLPAGLSPRQRESLRVFDAVRDQVLSVATRPPTPLEISIDSRTFHEGGAKLGLGSSAAVAVALTHALARGCDLHLDSGRVQELADTAHRAAQGGVGSGGDVAASSHGGLIEFTPGRDLVPLTWPTDLEMMVVTTGQGAVTTDLVGRVRALRADDPTRYQRLIDRLAGLARSARDTLGDTDSFLRLCSNYFDALSELDAAARAGIITDRHRELHTLAAAHGGVFKSSGAGGGDVGLAFSRSGEPATRLADALVAAGADIIPLSGGALGVHPGGGDG